MKPNWQLRTHLQISTESLKLKQMLTSNKGAKAVNLKMVVQATIPGDFQSKHE